MTTITASIANTIKPGTHLYWPEMGQSKPACQLEAMRSHYSDSYYVKSTFELKGRGIREVDGYANGVRMYRTTKLAYKKLETMYSIAMECLLD